MTILGFNHYNLRAERLMMEQLKVFYRDVVGLQIGERPQLTSFGYWLYAGSKDVLHLSEAKAEEKRKENELTATAKAIFTQKRYYTYQELTDRLQEYLDVKERTAKGYIKFMREKDIILKDPGKANYFVIGHG